MGLRDAYSLLRRCLIGRFGDAYVGATLLDGSGIWPGLLRMVNGHILAFAVGVIFVSMLTEMTQLVTKPDLPPCGSVEPELNFKDDDK